ncbi:hypothetical protein J3Q64DRAFT_1729653 [Phycomyces blakesleeanus]|uniref:Uncharacterized protein n=1 Tax=Phycomyces blakesleeanus TaxID=4837 RepID=A0ABR3B578_PHYBL
MPDSYFLKTRRQISLILTAKLYLMQIFFCQFFSDCFLLSALRIYILSVLALIAIKYVSFKDV